MELLWDRTGTCTWDGLAKPELFMTYLAPGSSGDVQPSLTWKARVPQLAGLLLSPSCPHPPPHPIPAMQILSALVRFISFLKNKSYQTGARVLCIEKRGDESNHSHYVEGMGKPTWEVTEPRVQTKGLTGHQARISQALPLSSHVTFDKWEISWALAPLSVKRHSSFFTATLYRGFKESTARLLVLGRSRYFRRTECHTPQSEQISSDIKGGV